MSLKVKLIIIGMLAVLWYLTRDPSTPADSPTLGVNDTAKVLLGKNKVTVVTDKGSTTKFVSDRATVTLLKSGDVRIDVKEWGFIHEMGLGGVFYGSKLLLSLDCQFLYYRQLGLHAGAGFDLNENSKGTFKGVVQELVKPYLALSYRLPFDELSNTSVFVGRAVSEPVYVGGFRVKF